MNPLKTTPVQWALWFVGLGFLVTLAILPVSSRVTRFTGLALAFGVWFAFITLVWRQRLLRSALLGVTLLAAGFLTLPARTKQPTEILRADYLAGLQRYQGVAYYWGGETSRGIDCSGLVRRGLIDALFQRGIRSLDAGLVRRAISLWWHDCTASALGDQHRSLTMRVLDTPSLNALDHSQVLPGDLAVTRSGIHILAHVGNNRWIEADPGVGSVITVTAPSTDNSWFQTPMNIVRWSILQ